MDIADRYLLYFVVFVVAVDVAAIGAFVAGEGITVAVLDDEVAALHCYRCCYCC